MGKCNLDDPEVRAQLAVMGSQTILFPPERETVFLGRNGQGRCVGVKVQDNVSSLVLFPITSRRYAARCQIHIPKQDAAYVAAALDPSDRVTVTRQNGRYVVVISEAGVVRSTVRVADLYELSKVFEHLDDQHAYDEDCPLCTGGVLMRTLEVRSFSREDLIDYLEYRILPLLKEEYTSGSDRASDSGDVESWTLYGDDEDE